MITFLLWAIVELSSVFMREAPDYTSQTVSQARMGVVVEVLDKSGYWLRIRTPEPYEGWVNEKGLTLVDDSQRLEWLKADRYICLKESTFILELPRQDSPRVCDFTMGDIARSTGAKMGRWCQIQLPSGKLGWVGKDCVTDFATWAHNARPEPEAVIAVARKFVGVPYMWGGISPKYFDCSGLVGFSYFMNGVILCRDASEQIQNGTEIPIDEMQAGDLVFFGETRVSHVALCIAPQRIIHSSQLVRINSLRKGDQDCYGRNIIGVRRMTNPVRIEDCPAYFSK